MTPDQLEPDVGALYRNRQTGELVILASWFPDANLCILENPASEARRTCSIRQFTDKYIHAKAGEP